MNIQTIFIVVIIIFFNFLLLNIFKLQKEISDFKEKNKDNKNINNKNINNLPGVVEYPTKYKELNNNDINSKLNKIADLVPIDINKVDKTNAKFKSKSKQIQTI